MNVFPFFLLPVFAFRCKHMHLMASSCQLLFKQIVPVYTGEGFIICMQNPKESDLVTDEIGVLKAYDDVVVEGANLYDGKIIS